LRNPHQFSSDGRRTLGKGSRKRGGRAKEVSPDASKNYLYASNRGHHSVAVFELEGAGGPVPAGHVPTGGEWPRNIAIDPAGRFLFAEKEHTDDVHAFGMDEGTGDLDPTGEVIGIPIPVCLKFRE
jgi:6-phosphogluconolactonase